MILNVPRISVEQFLPVMYNGRPGPGPFILFIKSPIQARPYNFVRKKPYPGPALSKFPGPFISFRAGPFPALKRFSTKFFSWSVTNMILNLNSDLNGKFRVLICWFTNVFNVYRWALFRCLWCAQNSFKKPYPGPALSKFPGPGPIQALLFPSGPALSRP